MKRHWVFFALLLVTALSSRAGSPDDAAAWLKKEIAPVFSDDNDLALKTREKLETSAVTPELKKLFAKDNAEIAKSGEVGKLGFDWVLNAQDTPLGWEVKTPYACEKDVVVPVATKWSDGNSVHFFLLTPSGKGWLISDVWFPRGGGTLLEILK